MRELQYPPELRYTLLHEWVRIEGSIIILGITDFAQFKLDDITLVREFPEIGQELEALLLPSEIEETRGPNGLSTRFVPGKTVAAIETLKWPVYAYSPVRGKIVAVNSALSEIGQGEIVNRDPYGEGWFVKVEVIDPSPLANLMDAQAYKKFVEEED